MGKKIVLITGATSGIGREAAITLAKEGYRVFASGRNEKALAEVAQAGGANLEGIAMDVTSEASIKAAHAEVLKRTDGYGVDVLVNNAGYGQAGPLIEMSDEVLRAQFATNVFGLMSVSRVFVPEMMARGGGRLVNITSGGGRMSFAFAGAYCASKYAVEAMSDALRVELRPFGVKVVLIEPGPIKTNFAPTMSASLSGTVADDSPYKAILSKADEIAARSDSMAFSPKSVVNGIRRAIEHKRPRARYATPMFLGPFIYLSPIVPASLMDFVSARAIGMVGEVKVKAGADG